MRPKETFLVPMSTLQRGSDFHRDVAQNPLGEISVLLGRSRDFELEVGQKVSRQRISVSQTAVDETMRGDVILSLWDAVIA